MSKLVNRLYDLATGQSDPYFDYHSGSGHGGGGYGHDNSYSLKTHSGNDYSLKTFLGGSYGGSYSSGYGDCCPPVIDPLTYAALLGFIALATYFFERLIAMSMLMKKRKRREIGILVEKGKKIIKRNNESGFQLTEFVVISTWNYSPFLRKCFGQGKLN